MPSSNLSTASGSFPPLSLRLAVLGVAGDVSVWLGETWPLVVAAGVVVITLAHRGRRTSLGCSPATSDNLLSATEHALRHLQDPLALANSVLFDHLPVSSALALQGSDSVTPLARARALRAVLLASIERLAGSSHDAAQALPYIILKEEYVIGRRNREIMRRLAIGEGTFYRYRRQAIHAVTLDLVRLERQATSDLAYPATFSRAEPQTDG